MNQLSFNQCVGDVHSAADGQVCNLTGYITSVVNETYGHLYIKDATGSVYVYGLLSGWGGKKQQFQSLNISEGARITLVGVRGQYEGEPQVHDAFYVEHENITE